MNAPLRKIPPLYLLGPDHSRCARPAWRWCRPRSRSSATRSGTRSAAGSTACSRRWSRPTRPIGGSARTSSSPATGRCISRTAPNLAAPMIAASARDHEQHSCLALIEINEHCNLTCPVCFAESSPARTTFTPLAKIEKMLDALVASEGEPDLVQISGGEPTLHPDFFAILDAVRARPIRHVMINTNGLRIAREPDFVAKLAENKRGLEIYLQFDSLAARRADQPARRRSAQHPPAGAGESRAARHLHHAGRDHQARRQRRRDRRHRPPRARLALRARRHLPAGAGRRPQRELRQGHATASCCRRSGGAWSRIPACSATPT